MPYTETAQHLDALCRCDESPLPKATRAWVAGWARLYITRAKEGAPLSVEACARMGGPGRPTWLRKEALAERDATLRKLHQERFPGMTAAEAEKQIRRIFPSVRSTFPAGADTLPGPRQLKDILKWK